MKLEIPCARTFSGRVKLATSRQQIGNLSVRWGFSNRLRNDEGGAAHEFWNASPGGLDGRPDTLRRAGGNNTGRRARLVVGCGPDRVFDRGRGEPARRIRHDSLILQ